LVFFGAEAFAAAAFGGILFCVDKRFEEQVVEVVDRKRINGECWVLSYVSVYRRGSKRAASREEWGMPAFYTGSQRSRDQQQEGRCA